jgi:hypothetical protein
MPFECSVRSILDAKQLLSQLTREMAIRLVSIRERTLEKTALYQTLSLCSRCASHGLWDAF